MKLATTIILGLAVPFAAALPLAAGELPANKWTRLETKAEPGYVWSGPVWVPSRGQLLHWGGQEHGKPSRNDVRAFDAAALDWASDYESDPPSGASGQSYAGVGGMAKSGRPRPYYVIQGGCWDSKREQLVYTMKGLMAAYDPKAKTWKDLGAKTVMPWPVEYITDTIAFKTETPGGPPVYGVGTCYDPENDEIVLFPHFDAKNRMLRDATGQITGHYGTFRYSFKDNAWTLVSDSIGSDEVKAARKGLVAVMAKVSSAMDAAWVLNRKPDPAKAAEAAKQVEAAAGELEKLAVPADAKAGLAPVAGLLKSAAAALSGGKAGDAMKPARDALWAVNEALDGALRVEPPARTAASMVYDPKNKCIVMFGGQTTVSRTDIGAGLAHTGLDDTWLYDVKTKQWREVAKANRPPRTRIPLLAYDPESGLVLLVTISGNVWDSRVPRKVALWTLDAAKGEWSKRDEQPWVGEIVTNSGGGSEGPKAQMPMDMFGFDAKNRLLLVMQPFKGGQLTCAMKLDLAKLSSEPAPAAQPAPPIKPYAPDLTDDPAWVAKLKALPANTWVAAKPPQEPSRRDWGIITVDPQRGCLVYFGGGHSSYQCNDVAVYSVGGNKWVTGAGDHNGHVPNNEWEGSTLGHRGGPPTGHQRNTYQSFDGRMYLFYGTQDKLPGNYIFHADPDYARFYDLDRGGVWRDLKIGAIERPEKVPPALYVSVADPKGRLFTLIGEAPGYYAANNIRFFVSCLDLNENKLVVKDVPKPFPEQRGLGEGRPFCYASDRDQIILMNGKPEDASRNYSEDAKKFPLKQVTYAYDFKENKFSELPAKKTPPVRPVQVVEYCEAQKCLLAVLGDQQWVYSFEKGDWAELEMKTEGGKMGFQHPYSQMVWVAKYGVFVNFAGNTWVMRPDFSQVKWE
ncbi:MAG TPA: kelch repeat-containing protein [Planctomycetota bacterium]|nr:kelch repeat-containing protein [Planctomycetota bacterium]